MDQNIVPGDPPEANYTIPKPEMLICYLLNGECVAMANGHDASRRMSAPTNNPKMKDIFHTLGINESSGLGVEIHFVDAKIA